MVISIANPYIELKTIAIILQAAFPSTLKNVESNAKLLMKEIIQKKLEKKLSELIAIQQSPRYKNALIAREQKLSPPGFFHRHFSHLNTKTNALENISYSHKK